MSDPSLSRRTFVLGAAGGAAALTFLDLRGAVAHAAGTPGGPLTNSGKLGPLSPVADARDGVTRLALPPGFGYRSFGIAGTTMSDGNVCPPSHDGSAVFDMRNGTLRLIRNHEIDAPSNEATNLSPTNSYDHRAGGGTTTVELQVLPDGSVEMLGDWVSLNGTHTNCSGGRTPWGSWLSCEETIEDDRPFVVNEENDEFQNGFERRHGYVFEVAAAANGPVAAEPIVGMGRFMHEAVAVDPISGDCYMTEDYDVVCFYRYRPDTYGQLRAGGVLQALRVRDEPGKDLRAGIAGGTSFAVDWVTIPDPDPDAGTTYEDAAQGVSTQGFAAGAARFTGLEGCTWNAADGSAVFLSTNGGNAGCGQVWAYTPEVRVPGNGARGPATDGGTLVLLYDSPGITTLSYPDAVTASNDGGLLVAEDGPGVALLRGIAPSGETFPIARAVDSRNDPSGPTFSPDGKVLFFNIMGEDPPNEPAMSFAVWGPWETIFDTSPDPVVPEVPLPALLSIAGVAAIAGLLALRNRGTTSDPAPA